MRQRDLLTSAEGQPETAGFARRVVRQGDTADNETGRGEGRDLSVIRAALVESRVGLKLRPEEARDSALRHSILGNIIPDDGATQAGGVGHRQRATGRRSQSDLPEALPHRERRRNHRTAASIAILAGGNGAVLSKEGDVAKSVRLAIGAVVERRHIDDDFRVLFRN